MKETGFDFVGIYSIQFGRFSFDCTSTVLLLYGYQERLGNSLMMPNAIAKRDERLRAVERRGLTTQGSCKAERMPLSSAATCRASDEHIQIIRGDEYVGGKHP